MKIEELINELSLMDVNKKDALICFMNGYCPEGIDSFFSKKRD